MNRARFLCLAITGLCLVTGTAPAADSAKSYPSRPVRFIVPFPPGGGTDILGRMLAQKLGAAMGQQFVVDNRGGAASLLGSALAAKSTADGYTLLLATGSFAISAAFYAKVPYDPVGDFSGVGLIAFQPLVLLKNPAVRAANVRELVALAKGSPDKLNYASGGAGGINHLAGELLKNMTGVRIVHVPYKGAGPALAGLIAGETDLFIATLGSALPHLRSGRVQALALASTKRSPVVPEIPTMDESGVAGYEATNWYGVLAPRGVPRVIVAFLNTQIVLALRDAHFQVALGAQGFEPASSTAEELDSHLRSEIRKWSRVVKERGIGAAMAP